MVFKRTQFELEKAKEIYDIHDEGKSIDWYIDRVVAQANEHGNLGVEYKSLFPHVTRPADPKDALYFKKMPDGRVYLGRAFIEKASLWNYSASSTGVSFDQWLDKKVIHAILRERVT